MNRSIIIIGIILFIGVGMQSCKKCQTCTTAVTQLVFGFEQKVSTSEEYCGKDFDNAPEEGTVNVSTGVIEQTVTITCKPS